MLNTKIELSIILDGEPFAIRFWTAVPRIGDSICLKDGTVKARIMECCWGTSSDSEKSIALRVSLVCETIKP